MMQRVALFCQRELCYLLRVRVDYAGHLVSFLAHDNLPYHIVWSGIWNILDDFVCRLQCVIRTVHLLVVMHKAPAIVTLLVRSLIRSTLQTMYALVRVELFFLHHQCLACYL